MIICRSSSACRACSVEAAVVSSKMCLSFRSCASGRLCRCFSRLAWLFCLLIEDWSTPGTSPSADIVQKDWIGGYVWRVQRVDFLVAERPRFYQKKSRL